MKKTRNLHAMETQGTPSIEARLDSLPTLGIGELRAQYRDLFETDPPRAFGPDLLRRCIAYRVQEIALGGLSKTSQRLLDKMVAAVLANPVGKLVMPRQAQLGVVMVREWKGRSYHVTMLDEGFAYSGRTYISLSEIAREITGTRWNGPRFFGLRKHKASEKDIPGSSTSASPPSVTVERRTGRPRGAAAGARPPRE